MEPRDIARFWSKVDVVERPEPCWLWRAGKDRDGYGLFKCKGSNLRAHRAAWELFNGPIGDRFLVACHKCDNPSCCNPGHLFIGTVADNWRDSYNKGRRVHAEEMRRGGNSNWAKLAVDDVREIRRLHAVGNVTHDTLAERFKVSRPTVTFIVNRKTWTHVE